MSSITWLEDLDQGDLPIAGGKGANLGALIRAGLPVPNGFCITTGAYRAFVVANGLDKAIGKILEDSALAEPAGLDNAAAAIGALFCGGVMDTGLAGEIREAYAALGGAVAVRSSATAEDLPDLSFAGQQDTYLNIRGEAAVMDAVLRCWASLWTARAIAYRSSNHIDQGEVALAVVVQEMVPSVASGVLFTVNPLTGKRGETVIEATLGLGEALVSGQVEPDHYLVTGGCISSRTLGAKALVIQGRESGGTVASTQSAGDRQALPDDQILELARLGDRAAAHFGAPQDMEWAWADGRLRIVQSRPVTTLFPLPEGLAAEPLQVLLSFGVWQGMLDPYAPLGRDVFALVAAGAGRLFGIDTSYRDQRVFLSAGERLFVNISAPLRNPIGRTVAGIFVAAIDPPSAAIIEVLKEDPRLAVKPGFGLGARLRLLRGLVPLVSTVLFNLLWPARGRKRLERLIDRSLSRARVAFESARDLAELAAEMETMIAGMPAAMLPRLVGGIAAGQAPYQILLRQAASLPEGPRLAMDLARGLPHNVTTEMDLALWRVSRAIAGDPQAAARFAAGEPDSLVSAFRAGSLGEVVQTALRDFLMAYGMRGVGEIDLGRPRWREDPTGLFQVLKSYLEISEAASPETMFERGAETARAAQGELEEVFRRSGHKMPRPVLRFMLRRFRELGGLRETPKFFIVRLLGDFRAAILEKGEGLVAAGTIGRADDLMFLHLWELRELAGMEPGGIKSLVASRRELAAREWRRKRVPRIMLSDGTAFHDAPARPGEDGSGLQGSPVSAGTVDGRVRVVLDPHGTRLEHGEILVCPATDPAWTPLFLAAGGLVMEVGGMMTHGSVVAREYGIPAVVGVSQATTRLRTGQRVRVDGSSGRVTILD